MIRYGYSVLPYGDEPLATSFERVARYGYDTIELLGDPDRFDADEINRLQDAHGVKVASICMLYGPATDVVSSSPEIRRAARDYIVGMLDRFQRVGVEVIPVTPTACMKITPEAPREQEWEWARETIRVAAEAGAERGIKIVIEPWNRYETYLINRLDQAVQMARDVDHPNVGVKGDLFHMNIEEHDPAEAIRATGSLLWHLDVADSTRAAPGVGHTDMVGIARALRDIDYDGILNFELLPAAGDPFLSIKGGGADEFKDRYTEQAITNLRRAVDDAYATASRKGTL
jgi:sugar phosphate isomerase/epimerase